MPPDTITRGFLAQFSGAGQDDVGGLNRSIMGIETWLESQRSQLPLLVPVGLGVGIVFWQLGGGALWPVIACLAAGMGLLAMAIGWQHRLSRLLIWSAALLLVGFGAIAGRSAYVSHEVLAKPIIVTFNGRIESVEDVSARGLVRYVLETGQHADLPRRVRVNVPVDQHRPEYAAGAIVQLKARLMPPVGPALPHSYDFARAAWFLGIGATGGVLAEPRLLTAAQGQTAFWSTTREGLAAHIRGSMPEGSGAIGAALLVGSRGAIAEEDAEALRNSGMAHLLSVSGLHVTAVVGGVFLLLSRSLALVPWIALRYRVPILAAGASAVVAVAYTLLTGAEVPTIRACVAALMILVALAMGREALSLRLLAFGACIVLLFWPEALAGPSFQLSFAAVATIIVLHESPTVHRWTMRRDEAVMMRLGRFIFTLLLTGVAIELVLAPIALFHFHKSGLYGALANIVAIPMTTFFVMPLQILALIFDGAGLGKPFWWLAGQGVLAIRWLAHAVSDAPGSVLLLPAMPRWAFGLAVVGGLWLAIVKGHARLWGVAPVIAGMIAMAFSPRPDLLVTGDGRHVAIVDPGGELVLLRPGVGEYALSMLSENAAIGSEPKPIDTWPGAQCSADICTFSITSAGRRWSIMASRSSYMVPTMELAAACKRADIVISERYLPWRCKPRWFKADRNFLERNGGMAIYFDKAKVETVAQTGAHHPWSQLGPKRKPKQPADTVNVKPAALNPEKTAI
jgi:competence protein ComEC